MKLDELEITEKERAIIQQSIKSYAMYGGISISVLSLSGDELTVNVKQSRYINKKLSHEALKERGEEVFKDITGRYKLNIQTETFKGNENRKIFGMPKRNGI